jgi:hypothetical protein
MIPLRKPALLRRLAVLAVVGVVALGLTGCSSKTSDAATMTYRDSAGAHTLHVSNSEFKKQLAELVGSTQFQSLLKTSNFKLTGDQKNTTGTNISTTYLGQLVEQAALDAEFTHLHLTISATDRSTATKNARAGFATASEIGQDAAGNQTFIGPGVVFASFPKSLQNALIDRQARTDAVRAYYLNSTAAKEQALYDEFAADLCPSGRVVSQILVKDVATARSILKQLQAGASFADLARLKSTDATSAKAGGAVGCLRKGAFVAPFEAAAYGAPFGVPTGPVKSQFGYHVILVNHPTFADLRPDLTQALQQNPLVASELRLQSMKVWINPQLGTGSLAVDSQQGRLIFNVQAPKAPAVRTCRENTATCAPPTSAASSTTVPAGG